jgi:DNA-binding transcriptional regulator YiaG
MSGNLLSINHNNRFAQIDSNIFGNRKLIIAEIKLGFLETVKTNAKNEAIKLINQTWNLPELAKDKDYIKEVTTQIVKTFLAHLAETGELETLAQKTPEITKINCKSQLDDTLWTKDFLNRAGARSRQALYQFGYLAKEVLKIDPYHNELALRLAIYLTLHSRVRLDGNYKVQELLEVALPVPEISLAREDYRKAYNLKQCWDSALRLLERLNWEIEFDEQSYPESLRPESNQKQSKGYFDKLLIAKICIRPPDPIPELLSVNIQSRTTRARRSQPQTKLKPSSCTELTGELIKSARTAKGWSQGKLAGFLNVSQNLVSLIERGERPINKKLEKKMRLLLEL